MVLIVILPFLFLKIPPLDFAHIMLYVDNLEC
jgi:hypothetical protein